MLTKDEMWKAMRMPVDKHCDNCINLLTPPDYCDKPLRGCITKHVTDPYDGPKLTRYKHWEWDQKR